jgi:flagellar protein FlaI
VHARERGKSARRIREVVEIESVDSKTEEVKSRVIFRWNPVTDEYEKVEESIKVGKIAAAKGGTEKDAFEEIHRRARILEWLKEKGIKDFLEITKYINMYYKEPSKLFEMMGERFEAKPMIPTRIPLKVTPMEKKKEGEKPKERVSLLSLLGFKILREK